MIVKTAFGAALRAAAALLFLGIGGAAAQSPRMLRIYGWPDYIAPSVLDDFTRLTGVEVAYDTFDSYADAEARLSAGGSGYDLAMVSPQMLAEGLRAQRFAPLDRASLPNWKNLDPFILARLAAFDPGNLHAIDYAWFTTGVAFNAAQAAQRLGNRPVDGWDAVFRPDVVRRFTDCGVYFLDQPQLVLPSALRWLGVDPDSKSILDMRRATETLTRVKSYVRRFSSTDYSDALADGDICLAIGTSSAAMQARDRARQAANGVDIGFAVPKEGAPLSMDALAIPADAPHKDLALQFLDYAMRPDVAARNADATGFASGNAAARALMDADVALNPAIYPDADAMRRLFVITPDPPALDRFVAQAWRRITSGR